jgi:hypothetical protein
MREGAFLGLLGSPGPLLGHRGSLRAVLRLLSALVFALVVALGVASGASALGPKTALRAISESYGVCVGDFGLEALGRRQENRAFATAIASESLHAARGIPGISRPFRAINAAHPPNAGALARMSNMRLNRTLDCSEIAADLAKAAGGEGRVLRVTPGNGQSTLSLLEVLAAEVSS